MEFYLADTQDITRAGLIYVIGKMGYDSTKYIEDRTELIEALKANDDAVIILDYTQFDFNDVSEIGILSERFHNSRWLIFSEDLSPDFMRQVTISLSHCGIVLKECSLAEIKESIEFAIAGKRYICQQVTEMLLNPQTQQQKIQLPNLTKTELEILKDIALGMTTKEIAARRFSSFHTINTHRKNIFRKLGVNNMHEAIKYALKAGLVDAAEYYI